MRLSRRTALAFPLGLAAPTAARAQNKVELSFLYPVAVGGPVTRIVDGYAADFMREHPEITVRPVYSGTYTDTLTKAQTVLKAGGQAADAPQMAVLLSTDAFSLIDAELVVPFDTLPGTAFLDRFYPAFMANGRIAGHSWGVPFQRSTIVLYWNKDAFRDAGLDPDRPPATWDEHAQFAARLTQNGRRWGTEIPGTGFTYWLFQALATEAGATLANGDGTETRFDSPEAKDALDYWIALTQSGAHPPGLVDWGTTPRDFLEGRAAMIWTTTGNLSNIRGNARFPFGVAMLPERRRRGSPTGGGNFYLFRAASPEQQAAAVTFLDWITGPERAAQWCIDTGYVATGPDAWATRRLSDYAAAFPPAAVARDQLQHAVPELSTHDNQRVTQALTDGLQAALLGRKASGPALADAQASATRLLRPFK